MLCSIFGYIWWPFAFLSNCPLVEVLPMVAIWHFWAILPLVNPSWPLPDLWRHQYITLWSWVRPTIFGGHGAFLRNLTSGWPFLICTWPWPQQCIMLWSWVLSTIFGGHRALLSKLTPTWPQLTPSWSLIPAMHYTFIRDSSYQIWWPWDTSKQIDPYLTPSDP